MSYKYLGANNPITIKVDKIAQKVNNNPYIMNPLVDINN